jgi:hypothetical protein
MYVIVNTLHKGGNVIIIIIINSLYSFRVLNNGEGGRGGIIIYV